MSLLEKFSEVFEKKFYEAADILGYRTAKGVQKKEIKQIALNETLKELPQIKPLLDVRGTWHPHKSEKPTIEQLEGQKFYSRIGVVVLKYMKNGRNVSETNTKDFSVKDRFEEACRLGFVPSAEVAAALLGCDRSYPLQLIRRSEEFSFTKVENGYKVESVVDQKKKQRVQELESQVALILKELQELKK